MCIFTLIESLLLSKQAALAALRFLLLLLYLLFVWDHWPLLSLLDWLSLFLLGGLVRVAWIRREFVHGYIFGVIFSETGQGVHLLTLYVADD